MKTYWALLFAFLVLSSCQLKTDETGPQFPPRTAHQVAELNGVLFRIGGKKPQKTGIRTGTKKYFTDVERSRDGYNWEVLQSHNLPTECLEQEGFVLQTFQRKLHFLGGDPACTLESQNGTDWQKSHKVPPGSTPPPINFITDFTARTHHAAAVFQNKLFLFGGQKENSTRFLDDFWSFDGLLWSPEPNPPVNSPSARGDHQVVEFNSRLYIIGGIKNDRGDIVVDAYKSTDGFLYTNMANLINIENNTFERAGHQSVIFDDKIWIIGGYKGSQRARTLTYKNDVWASADGTKWNQLAEIENLPRQKYAFQSIVFQNKILLIGANITWESADGELWQSDWQKKR